MNDKLKIYINSLHGLSSKVSKIYQKWMFDIGNVTLEFFLKLKEINKY